MGSGSQDLRLETSILGRSPANEERTIEQNEQKALPNDQPPHKRQPAESFRLVHRLNVYGGF